jgi:hypothetical protein
MGIGFHKIKEKFFLEGYFNAPLCYQHCFNEELVFLGNLTGTVLSWSTISWILINVTKKENIPANIFCITPNKETFFIFPELRSPKQGEGLCSSFGTVLSTLKYEYHGIML